MKKLAAMLLTLCMLLAAVPALGEDFSGTWYMVLEDVTVGTIVLNADGTSEVSLTLTGSDVGGTGSWAADGNTVTVTVQGAPLDLTYNEETGVLFNADKFPIPIQRTAGKFEMQQILDISNGTAELPEGVTMAEFQAAMIQFYAAAMEVASSMNGTGSETGDGAGAVGTEPAEAPAAPELTVVQESFKVIEAYRGYTALYIAKVRNDTAEPLYLRGGHLTVTDAEGNQVGEAKYLDTTGSKWLDPGEVSVLSMEADLEENIEVSYTKEFEITDGGYYSKDVPVTLTDPAYIPAHDYEGAMMKATVINDTGALLPGLNVIYILEDAEGNPLDVRSEMIYRHELGVDSSITMYTSVDSKVADYLNANGIEPAAVEAYAWVSVKD